MASLLIGSQLDDMRERYKGDPPQAVLDNVRNSVVQNLINQELVQQAIKKYGLVATKAELEIGRAHV